MNIGFAEVNELEAEIAPCLFRLSSSRFNEIIPTETAADIIDAREMFQNKVIESIPAWRFKDDGLSLKANKAISIYVCRVMNHYCAENESLNIYAVGESYAAAIEAFKHHLIYLYQHYKSLSWDDVTGEAECLKQSYNDLFVED
ncbi:MAG: hypothetical protein IBX61_00805 [Thermoleophilia bacterium]|nr:hypothetical protein [Thermoleophilia bacterium]